LAAQTTESNLPRGGRLLAFATIVEVGTGLALIVDPALVIRLLLGTNDFGQLLPVAQCFGVALLALGLACWPSAAAGNGLPALRGMLTYNLLIALFLAYIGVVERVGGLLLWPAVGVHAIVALLLARSWRAAAHDT
jgi:hypothetical protein